MRRTNFQWKKGVFSEKGGGNSVNEKIRKDFYRKGNSVKSSRPFSEPADSVNWKVAVLIPFIWVSSAEYHIWFEKKLIPVSSGGLRSSAARVINFNCLPGHTWARENDSGRSATFYVRAEANASQAFGHGGFLWLLSSAFKEALRANSDQTTWVHFMCIPRRFWPSGMVMEDVGGGLSWRPPQHEFYTPSSLRAPQAPLSSGCECSPPKLKGKLSETTYFTAFLMPCPQIFCRGEGIRPLNLRGLGLHGCAPAIAWHPSGANSVLAVAMFSPVVGWGCLEYGPASTIFIMDIFGKPELRDNQKSDQGFRRSTENWERRGMLRDLSVENLEKLWVHFWRVFFVFVFSISSWQLYLKSILPVLRETLHYVYWT